MALSSTFLASVAIPREVIWCYSISGIVFVIGVAGIFTRGDWAKARGLEKLIVFGPVFYAMPIAAFGTEHYMIPTDIASMVPSWIPWHMFWTYFVGTGLILAGLSFATKIQTRLAASLIGLMFFLFVLVMDIPAWRSNPHDRFSAALALRELSFSGGALALAGSLTNQWRERGTHILAALGRYFITAGVLFYSFEQFLHADYVPAIPLDRLTPAYVPLHTVWTYLAAAVYAVAGIMLLIGKKTRLAAACVGLTVFVVELIVYVPIGVANRGSLVGINFLDDTLMYCGAVLLLAGAMPKAAQEAEPELAAAAG
jgi:uncharacterized membrane protein YphA (DoxX/SURF4 family)